MSTNTGLTIIIKSIVKEDWTKGVLSQVIELGNQKSKMDIIKLGKPNMVKYNMVKS